MSQSLDEIDIEMKDKFNEQLTLVPPLQLTHVEYSNLVNNVYRLAGFVFMPNSHDEYVDRLFKHKESPESGTTQDIQVFKLNDDGTKTLAASIQENSCVLYQPFDEKLLNTVLASYHEVEVSKCGSLKAALALQDQMKGSSFKLSFSKEAINSIQEHFQKHFDKLLETEKTKQLDELNTFLDTYQLKHNSTNRAGP